jgi:hypothetical protein
VPDILLLPFVGLLFRVRDEEGNLQWPKPLSDATPTTSRSGAKAKTKERTGASGGRRPLRSCTGSRRTLAYNP